MNILAIETSCDETAAAVLSDLTVLSNVISSQIDIHKRFGGVVPEIASRNHTLQIKNVVEAAVADSGISLSQIDAIAVTYGAGLLGALLVGVSFAKSLAYALGKPLYAVNHIAGHISANHLLSLKKKVSKETSDVGDKEPEGFSGADSAQDESYADEKKVSKETSDIGDKEPEEFSGADSAQDKGCEEGKKVSKVTFNIESSFGTFLERKVQTLPPLTPPYICLIASGGHTAVAEVNGYPGTKGAINILGETQDDAAGEAFDKVARVLGLAYPGGPQIEKLAKLGTPGIELPTPLKNQKGYDFSYSGLKTSVINIVNQYKMKHGNLTEEFKADLAASFQDKATSLMADNAVRAAKDKGIKTLVIAGGVAANTVLRGKAEALSKPLGIKVVYPPLKYCTDNAAMIGAAAYFMIKAGVPPADIDLDANANLYISNL